MTPASRRPSFGVWLSGLLEGVGIALDSIKSNRVRAALTNKLRRWYGPR